jgi:hypothetical protein
LPARPLEQPGTYRSAPERAGKAANVDGSRSCQLNRRSGSGRGHAWSTYSSFRLLARVFAGRRQVWAERVGHRERRRTNSGHGHRRVRMRVEGERLASSSPRSTTRRLVEHDSARRPPPFVQPGRQGPLMRNPTPSALIRPRALMVPDRDMSLICRSWNQPIHRVNPGPCRVKGAHARPALHHCAFRMRSRTVDRRTPTSCS